MCGFPPVSSHFSEHAVHRGHVAARSGDALTRVVCDVLNEQRVEHAVTGLAAGWMYTQFAAFRVATVYVPLDPPIAVLERLGWNCSESPIGYAVRSQSWLAPERGRDGVTADFPRRA